MVRTVTHDVFGEIEFDPEDGENRWESEVELDGRPIELDLTFDGATVDGALLDPLSRYVADLPSFDRQAQTLIRADLAEEESAVRDYIEQHLEEPGVVDAVFGGSAPDVDGFLAKLSLVRVGIGPADHRPCYEAVFDYTLGEEVTNYLVVVKFGEDGVTEVTSES
jgi:hypothetical protein